MSTFRNKNSGLRILWIPGKKKHNRKGHYESTSKQVEHSAYGKNKRKYNIWSTDGNKKEHHEDLFDNDITPSLATSTIGSILPGTYVVAAADSSMQVKSDEFPVAEITAEDDKYSLQPDIRNSNNAHCEAKDPTIPDDNIKSNTKQKNKKKNRKKRSQTEAQYSAEWDRQHDGDEKIAKCLYVTLMCCECTIS